MLCDTCDKRNDCDVLKTCTNAGQWISMCVHFKGKRKITRIERLLKEPAVLAGLFIVKVSDDVYGTTISDEQFNKIEDAYNYVIHWLKEEVYE